MTESRAGGASGRWIALCAWVAIVEVVAWVAFVSVRDFGRGPEMIEAELAVRSVLGARSFGGTDDTVARREIGYLDDGDAGMRQRAAVLADEVWGARGAAQRVASAAGLAAQTGGETARVQEVLTALYPRSPPKGETQAARVARLTADDRALLARNLGWFGRLATSPADGDPAERAALVASERRTLLAMGTIVTFLVVGGAAGAALIALGLVLALLGKLRLRHDVPPGRRTFGAETFALWLLGVEVWFRFVAPALPLRGSQARLAMFAVEVATLGALAVGVARGVPWPELRRRIGWHRGAGLVREAAAGLVGVLLDAALTGAGLLAYWIAAAAAGRHRVPGEGAHPIVVELARSAAPDAAVLVLLGAVSAPIVEETMFRGVLFGHLRESTARWPRALSVATSAVVSAAVFASLHPQGWTAVPALAGSGIALALVREWRGSLVAPMVTHAVWNGSLLVLVRIALAP